MTLEPLYDTIDPAALDSLVRTTETSSTDGTMTAAFVLDGHEVMVQRDVTVVVWLVEVCTEQE